MKMNTPTYSIRPAEATDIPVMLQLAAAARAIMRKSGNLSQWPDSYPSAEVFQRDIDRGGSFLMLDGERPVATFACLPGPEPTYDRIYDGQWLDDEQPYLVVHRIASLPEAHGVFHTMLDYCAALSGNIRIDTHRDNHIMQHLLECHGFTYCGIILLANGDERLAYQRISPQHQPTDHGKADRIARIRQMEQSFDRLTAAVEKLSAALDAYKQAKKDIEQLTAYYDGGAWRSDFEADEAGLLPADLKRGVLSEDGLWNLLSECHELIELTDARLS